MLGAAAVVPAILFARVAPHTRRWVAEQSSSAPKELWTDGVEDYLKYAKQLLADFKDVLEGSSSPAAAAAPAAAGFGFGFGSSTGAAAPAAPAPAGGSSKPPLAPGGLFGAGAGSGSQGAAAPASIFGPLPTTGAAFTLGSSGGGGFGGSAPGSAANSAGGSLFNVPSTGTLGSSFGTAATGADDDDGDEETEQQVAEPSVSAAAWGCCVWRSGWWGCAARADMWTAHAECCLVIPVWHALCICMVHLPAPMCAPPVGARTRCECALSLWLIAGDATHSDWVILSPHCTLLSIRRSAPRLLVLHCSGRTLRSPVLARLLSAGPAASWRRGAHACLLADIVKLDAVALYSLTCRQVQLEAEGTEMLAKQRVKLMSMTPEKKWKDKGQVGGCTHRRQGGPEPLLVCYWAPLRVQSGRFGWAEGQRAGVHLGTGLAEHDVLWRPCRPGGSKEHATQPRLAACFTHPPPYLPPQGTLTLRRATGDDAAAKKPYFVFTTDSGAPTAGAGNGLGIGGRAGWQAVLPVMAVLAVTAGI